MSRHHNRLTARAGQNITKPGRYADGGGLYLLVRQRGEAVERLWLFRHERGQRSARRETAISLGPARDVSIARARMLAGQCRQALAAGEDPRQALARVRGVPTFAEVADQYLAAIAPGLDPKTLVSWRHVLGERYCRSLRRLAVDKITTEHVLAVLKPAWAAKPETAQKMRSRIERVLDNATVAGLRAGANPARWRGHLAHLLAKRSGLTRGHHAALPWAEVPELVRQLRELDSITSAALEFTILTAARTSETTGATWPELDVERRIWTIPAARMKAKREHRVPLGDRALAILEDMARLGQVHCFPGRNLARSLSAGAMKEFLDRVRPGVTVHGFRSAFRDWVGEATSFPSDLAEAALAHVVGSKTERAYRRGDALERRRELMAAWEQFCSATDEAGTVVPFRRVGQSAGTATREDC